MSANISLHNIADITMSDPEIIETNLGRRFASATLTVTTKYPYEDHSEVFQIHLHADNMEQLIINNLQSALKVAA